MSDTLSSVPVVDGVRYKKVPGFFGYLAGTDGSILSARKPSKNGLRVGRSWIVKSSWPNEDGYRLVHLCPTVGKAKRRFAHVVVLETFIGPCPPGKESLHRNGVPSDNRLDNLRWGTRAENMADARRHGTIARREKNGRAKLNLLRLRALEDLRMLGWNQRDVATILGVTQPTISAVENGHRWEKDDDQRHSDMHPCKMDDQA